MLPGELWSNLTISSFGGGIRSESLAIEVEALRGWLRRNMAVKVKPKDECIKRYAPRLQELIAQQ